MTKCQYTCGGFMCTARITRDINKPHFVS